MAAKTKKKKKPTDKARTKVEAVALETLEVVYVGVDEIQPNDWNPNRQDDDTHEMLKQSILTNGFTQPVIAVRDGNVIVDGYHRWKAAFDLGFEEIPVVYTDMTLEQAKLATLTHNRARGSEDIELATDVLRDLQSLGALDWAANQLMMSDEEINKLLEDVPVSLAMAGEDYAESWDVGTDQAERTITGRKSDDRSMTRQAAQHLEDVERRVKKAKTEEEKSALRKDAQVFRIYLTFDGSEGNLVRKALGDNPAEAIVEMCKARAAE